MADGGVALGRETKSEAILVPRLRAALERLNSFLPPEAISGAIDQLTRDRSAMSLAATNRVVYDFLEDGILIRFWMPCCCVAKFPCPSDSHAFA